MLSQMFGKLCEQNFKMPAAVKIRNEVCQEIGEVTKIIQILSSLGPEIADLFFVAIIESVRSLSRIIIRSTQVVRASRMCIRVLTAHKTRMEMLDKLSGIVQKTKRSRLAAIPHSRYPPARCHLDIALYIVFIQEILHVYSFCNAWTIKSSYPTSFILKLYMIDDQIIMSKRTRSLRLAYPPKRSTAPSPSPSISH
jgi:hypothetical protein